MFRSTPGEIQIEAFVLGCTSPLLPFGQFTSVYEVVGGTGPYAGASGTIDVQGTSNGLQGSATYQGELHLVP